MAVKIDPDVCGHIANCPVQGLCIKLCEQGAIIEEDGHTKLSKSSYFQSMRDNNV